MRWIDNIINGLIDMYNTNNPYEICDLLGIEIKHLSTENIILLNNNSIYIRDYFDKEVIFIKEGLNHHYEHFYLCHELGHAILHPGISDTIMPLGKLEKQANYFAFKLSEISFDEVAFNGLNLEQIASSIEIPYEVLKNII